MTGFDGFLFGLIGGTALEFLELARVGRLPKRERNTHTHDHYFWFLRAGSALIGGLLGMAYTVSATHPVEVIALTVGAAWPTVVGRAGELAYQVVAKTN